MPKRSPAPLALALCALCACVRNPVTGRLELNLLSRQQEIDLGQQGKKEVEATIGVYQDARLGEYVASVGEQIAAVTKTDYPFSYEIADDSSVNAFALPGGPVFITRGILAHMTTEGEMAAVLGHESGHVVARHSASQISKQQMAQLGLGIGSILSPTAASLAQAAGVGLQVLFLKYSRDDETQADELGFRFMTKAGWDPHQMIPLFHMLDNLTAQSGGGKTPDWLETHPNPGNRIEATQERLKTELKGDLSTLKVERDKYCAMIDGIVFGEDPRKGYFKGDLFLEPELKFQMQFPQGWQHQNTPQAVAAISKDQDAVIQLAVAGKMSPEEAARHFFAQQGVKQGQAAQGTIHQKSAVSAYFTAQTQQGAVEGLATFLGHEGTTYAIFGYAAAGKLQGYDATFKSSMGSFATLSDPAALNVQPAKLKVAHIDSPMSVTDFNNKYPSSVKIEVVALINGVDKGGTIPAGPAKQVVGGIPPSK